MWKVYAYNGRFIQGDLVSKHSSEAAAVKAAKKKIDFKKQVEYFYNANMIIGVHGGWLSNCIFSQENTVVIETEPKRDEYYSKLALCAGMKYYSCGEETKEIIKQLK